MNPAHWLQLHRTVRFGDTDAAGVMHFHQLLRWCHEAYEESLERFGVSSQAIFPVPSWAAAASGQDGTPAAAIADATTRPEGGGEANAGPPAVALPIIHCSADFRQPLICGDRLEIHLRPERLDPGSFELRYRFLRSEREVAQGLTRHLAIETASRRRCPLPPAINRWLEASGLAQGVRPL